MLRRHILNSNNACRVETDTGTDQQMDEWIAWAMEWTTEREGAKRLVIGSNRSGRHRGVIKGGKEAWMEGWKWNWEEEVLRDRDERNLFFNLCNPPDSSQRERAGEKERKRKDGKEKQREKEEAPWQITCQPLWLMLRPEYCWASLCACVYVCVWTPHDTGQ